MQLSPAMAVSPKCVQKCCMTVTRLLLQNTVYGDNQINTDRLYTIKYKRAKNTARIKTLVHECGYGDRWKQNKGEKQKQLKKGFKVPAHSLLKGRVSAMI